MNTLPLKDKIKLMESRGWTGVPSIPQLEAAWQSGKGLCADISLGISLKRSMGNVVELLRGGLSPHKEIVAAVTPALKLEAEWFCIGHDYAFTRALALYSRISAGKMISVDKPPSQGQQQQEVEVCFCGEGEEGFMIACDLCNEWFHADW